MCIIPPFPRLKNLVRKLPEAWASELIGPKEVSLDGVSSHTDI